MTSGTPPVSPPQSGVGSGGEGEHEVRLPSVAEVEAMTYEEAMIAAAEADGVRIVHRRERFPVPGTKQEKRLERTVAGIFATAGLLMVAFIVVFIVAPWRFHSPGRGSQAYALFTPALGATLGLSLLLFGVGAVLWAKWLMPEEEAVQDRHDTPEPLNSQLLTVGTLNQAYRDTGLPRRSVLRRAVYGSAGLLAAGPLVAVLGGLLKKPGKEIATTLWGVGTPVIEYNGRRIGPADLEPGGLLTVFPGVEEGTTDPNSPVLLIRLRPGQEMVEREGQRDFRWEDFVAFSKICTHAGCPASLYEQQTARLLCPCHQSQFDVLQAAKPVFGPAARSLPQLPLGVETVDGVQYFVSRRDFIEPVGPSFWNRGRITVPPGSTS